MKKVAEVISMLSLVLIVLAPVLFYIDKVSLDQNKTLMLLGTVVWFVSAVFWMGHEKEKETEEVEAEA